MSEHCLQLAAGAETSVEKMAKTESETMKAAALDRDLRRRSADV